MPKNIALRISLILFLIVLISGCSENSINDRISVKHAGALKNFMHEGDVSAKASLDSLNPTDLYAVGALENLKGELIIIDGQPYLSRVVNGEVEIDKSYDSKASLMVYSYVSDWRQFQIEQPINSKIELEGIIEEYALQEGIDLEKPFPFMVKGKLFSFTWHVVNWPEHATIHTHEKHITSGLNGVEEDREITILGFYSRNHKGIFTHHTTNMHMHVLTDDWELSAHVDEVVPGESFVVMLPK